MAMKVSSVLSVIATAILIGASSAGAALVSYYTFDAQNAADISGNGNNGTLVGGATFSATEKPAALTGSTHALALDGVDDRVNIAHSSSLTFGGGVVTVSLWMKSDTADTQPWMRVISKGGPTTGFELQRNSSSANSQLRVDTTTQTNQATQNPAGVWNGGWHHVVFTLNNGVSTVWLDGVKTTGSYNGTNFSTTAQLILGDTDRETDNREFAGWMDDVAIWDQALTDADVAGLFAGTLSPLNVVPETSSLLLGLAGGALLIRRRRTS